MRFRSATVRRALLPGVACGVIAVVGLLIAGSRPLVVRTATADAPNQLTIAELHPGQRVCEGPLTSQGPARSVAIWGASARGLARLTVTVEDAATHAVLTSGPLHATPLETDWTARLARAVPGDRPLQVCLTEDTSVFSLSGSAVSAPTVSVTGVAAGQRFSLVLLSDANRSVLGSLSTAFSRASLWRPSWVGSWTFWVLTLVLLGTFGLGVAAVTFAAADDDEERPPRQESRDDNSPRLPDSSPDGGSEAGQDRPQTVS
jgi:hypothetical protein